MGNGKHGYKQGKRWFQPMQRRTA